MRVGIGYDVHRFHGKGPLRLGGIIVPSARGLLGHSDADVLLHAVADALFGAIGAADIGEQFPSSDSKWRKVNSRRFIDAAIRQVRRKGFAVANIDATVVADTPKLIGYKTKMAKAISAMLKIAPSQVSVKAKTTETFCPGKEGIAAQAVVLLDKAKGKRQKAKGKRRGGTSFLLSFYFLLLPCLWARSGATP
ncbi:MAG: 2-C-methyl-D-erythritol 2,4-cyclodiphosphate synthase [Candidatus Omnitrophica bacterium]|nr:2-C-methyl-D-erythritol 2,4-cyclodiphosphate synthase [Candidatus Omnitrophota bacterium]